MARPPTPGATRSSYAARRRQLREQRGLGRGYGYGVSSTSRRFDELRTLGARFSADRAAAAAAGAVGAQKPFANFSPPPTVSPYLNLFTETQEGVDAYHTLVQPFIQQRNQNLRVGSEISGLQRGQVRQTQALQQIGRAQGTAGPQFFMNHGNFFPGLAQ